MRVQGWARALNEYLLAAQERYVAEGFAAGEFDCCTFVADWVHICLGDDPMPEYRGRYSSLDEGFVLLGANDGSLKGALTRLFGDPEHPSQAQRGDVLFSETLSACGICIVQGTRMLGIFLGEGGFALHRARDCDHAFRVR